MLQIIIRESSRYSIPEQMQMAIEGGCEWLVLDTAMADHELRELAAEIVPLCRESATILTIVNRPEMARELGLHGVLLIDSERPAAAVREELGPEAIIGVQVTQASSAIALARQDIDYVTFPEGMDIEEMRRQCHIAAETDASIPMVAAGDFLPDDIAAVMATGVNGVAVCRSIVDADDPVGMTVALIAALNASK